MKYIRTIIDTIEILVCEDANGTIVTEKYDEFGNKIKSEMKSSWIKKTANTIEELCDEFAIFGNETKRPIQWFNIVEIKERIEIPKIATLYGYIWVELPNGAMRLEPVAKLNDEGELELL